MVKKTSPREVHTRFKKGVSGNPGGRPKKPSHLQHLNKLTKDEINLMVAKYSRMTVSEVEDFLDNDDIPLIDAVIAKSLMTSFKTGNLFNFNMLMDRVFGRPAPINMLVQPNNNAPQVIVTLPSNGKEAEIIDAEIKEE